MPTPAPNRAQLPGAVPLRTNRLTPSRQPCPHGADGVRTRPASITGRRDQATRGHTGRDRRQAGPSRGGRAGARCRPGRLHHDRQGLHADPELLTKSRSGRSNEVRRCIVCAECVAFLTQDQPAYCAVNPATVCERALRPIEVDAVALEQIGPDVALVATGASLVTPTVRR